MVWIRVFVLAGLVAGGLATCAAAEGLPADVTRPAPPPRARALRQLGVAGQKTAAPQTRMSEARITWSLSPRISFHLGYERTAYGPTMAHDHDDGVVSGFRVGF